MRKRFFQLCSGPLEGRTISPRNAADLLAHAAGRGAKWRLAVPPDFVTATDEAPGAGHHPDELVHLYEGFDLVDEISLEIVLCKYVGTRRRYEVERN